MNKHRINYKVDVIYGAFCDNPRGSYRMQLNRLANTNATIHAG